MNAVSFPGAGAATPTPTITSLSPTHGGAGGATALTITGTGFQASCTVTVGGVAATSVVRVSATSVTCVTPAESGTFGPDDVVVTNPDGRGSTSRNFGFDAPTVTAITPSAGPLAGSTSITDLHGTGFVTGATVTIGGAAATSVAFVSSVKLTCTTPAHATTGAVDVVVTNPDTQVGTGAALFTYSPTVTGVSPASGSYAGGTALTLTGTGFNASPTVTVGGVAATSVVRVSSTSITCVTGAHAAGAVDVVVTNTDASAGTGASSFTYLNPTISSVSASSGTEVGGTAITITGTLFASGAGLAVTIGGVTATSIVRVSSTSITCVTPAGTVGAQNVIVTNPDGGTVTSAGGFTYTFDPLALSLTGWVRDYAGAPWAGTASAGNSGSHSFASSGLNPTTGTAVDTHVPAVFDGATQSIQDGTANGNAYIDTGTHEYTIVAVIKPTNAQADTTVTANPALIGVDGGNWGFTFSSVGVRVFHYDGAYKESHTACTADAWHFAVARFNKTTGKLSTDIDGVHTETSSVGNLSGSVAFPIRLGKQGTHFYQGQALEVMIADSALSDARIAQLRTYFQARYPSASLP